ncbi:MAG: phosphoribosylanthranilate isomerase [Candidatus Omnitrophota bacterium]
MTKIKICGITNKTDALAASEMGVDMLGFVFSKDSKRYVEPRTAEDIVNELPQSVKRAGVFVNEERAKVLEIAQDAALDILQFHGDETPEYCKSFKGSYKVIKAFRLKDKESLKKVNEYDVDFYLFDTFSVDARGGTGEVFNWDLLKDFEVLKPVILSGGLTPKNVQSAIKELAPYGVDVSTGVEKSPGKKDHELMKKFIDNVRKAE